MRYEKLLDDFVDGRYKTEYNGAMHYSKFRSTMDLVVQIGILGPVLEVWEFIERAPTCLCIIALLPEGVWAVVLPRRFGRTLVTSQTSRTASPWNSATRLRPSSVPISCICVPSETWVVPVSFALMKIVVVLKDGL
eukprot:9137567-Pyramimonas_sp.AAC.1